MPPKPDSAHPRRRWIAAPVGGSLAALLLLAGCAAQPPDITLPQTPNGYTSADDTVVEIPAAERDAPVTFGGPLDTGGQADSTDWLGSVVVVNFWYAACPPCRAEAPDLQATYEQYADQGVVFIGVNVRDTGATATAFATEFDITYPSILDAATSDVQFAFAGKSAPNAVPTTIVLDRDGRMASRILGRIPSRGTLAALIDTALTESRTP
ncbi:TlpA disulfide reductase family protein [Microbacterium proteolyticum]|uniref:Thiol-disulfide isomerase/thioredoxin n=1 Tax=Compostimonas suwonensis TaxID=1048394 RepID=A0A2M9BC36_9MICO|nr:MULTISPECIES: TlpA disulfide reductase family protein [Microbacteriaceae]PJJ55496.1 thiol-disulfide isomerase/thioredoxin [Compostimonas suwonensis]